MALSRSIMDSLPPSLPSGNYIHELDIDGSLYNTSVDEQGVPTRELNDFRVFRNHAMCSICELDDPDVEDKTTLNIIATGTLICTSNPTADNYSTNNNSSDKKTKCSVVIGPLLEWCIEYGMAPKLYIHTELGWYSLNNPAKDYTKKHMVTRRRFEICSRAFILATTLLPSEATYTNFVALLSAPFQNMRSYTEKEIVKETDFILEQAASLEDPSLLQSGFCVELKRKREEEKRLVLENPAEGAMTTATKGVEKDKDKDKASRGASSSGNLRRLGSSGSTLSQGRAEPAGPRSRHSAGNIPAASTTSLSTIIGTATGGGGSNMERMSSTSGVSNAVLLKKGKKMVNALMKEDQAYPFLEPVVPELHGCPDYLDVISKPMDLGTVKKNLDQAVYSNNFAQFISDVRQIWYNCKKYNADGSELFIMAESLETLFEKMIVENDMSAIALSPQAVVEDKKVLLGTTVFTTPVQAEGGDLASKHVGGPEFSRSESKRASLPKKQKSVAMKNLPANQWHHRGGASHDVDSGSNMIVTDDGHHDAVDSVDHSRKRKTSPASTQIDLSAASNLPMIVSASLTGNVEPPASSANKVAESLAVVDLTSDQQAIVVESTPAVPLANCAHASCSKPCNPPSKYCGDACGLQVAEVRFKMIMEAGGLALAKSLIFAPPPAT